jgi:hypothetical protein
MFGGNEMSSKEKINLSDISFVEELVQFEEEKQAIHKELIVSYKAHFSEVNDQASANPEIGNKLFDLIENVCNAMAKKHDVSFDTEFVIHFTMSKVQEDDFSAEEIIEALEELVLTKDSWPS